MCCLTLSWAEAAWSDVAAVVEVDPAAHVDPLIGTGGKVPLKPGARGRYEDLPVGVPAVHPFGGLTYPGAVVPFGMVALSPDTGDDGHGWSGGYTYYDDAIIGFSHMHTSGNGRGFGHVLFLPTTSPIEPSGVHSRARFSHARERAEAGSYRVTLDDEGVEVELTATARAGFHRYTFLRGKPAHVIIDLRHALGRWKPVREAGVQVKSGDLITGMRAAEQAKGPVYFAARFSRPFSRVAIAADGPLTAGQTTGRGRDVKVVVDLDTSADPVVLVKVGLSWTSVDAALANLDAEIPDWDFERTRKNARRAWNEALGKIQVKGGSEAERRIFYTALYHAQLAPFVFCDVDGRYLGADGRVHKGSFQNHTFFSLWDTYRAQHPLLTVIQPERVPDMLRSMLAQAESDGGQLPVYTVAGGNGFGMAGMHAMPVLADAYLKGIRGFDAHRALGFMRENMLRKHEGLDTYATLGWVAADKTSRAAAATLEYALDDFAVAEMARALGKSDEAARFRERAANYRNVIDTRSGFARGRLSDGSWRTPFDPRAVSHYQPGDDFVEANAWQYTFFAPHDVAGLAARLGGRKALERKLDRMFEEPPVLTGNWSADVTGLWGQYAHGNEQSHHVAYLYNWTGAPWKTQQRVRDIMARFYSDKPEGLAGNDDAGQLSSWYVWSAMGLYPVNPVGGVYVIGSPLFEEVIVDVGRGRRFRVIARGNGPRAVYIRAAKLNGRPLRRTWVSHDEVMAGATLELTMSERPEKRWGSSPTAAPPSMSDASPPGR